MHKSVVKFKDSIVARNTTLCGTHCGPGSGHTFQRSWKDRHVKVRVNMIAKKVTPMRPIRGLTNLSLEVLRTTRR